MVGALGNSVEHIASGLRVALWSVNATAHLPACVHHMWCPKKAAEGIEGPLEGHGGRDASAQMEGVLGIEGMDRPGLFPCYYHL